jgi:hypothetical protein
MAHNHEVRGSSPLPATKKRVSACLRLFSCYLSSNGVTRVGGGTILVGIGTPGGVTTTVTMEESLAVKLFAVPSAMAVFTVVAVKFI